MNRLIRGPKIGMVSMCSIWVLYRYYLLYLGMISA